MAGSDLAINRAGSLVGSILESAGYIYQSKILDAIQGPFVNEVGGLVYLFAITLLIVEMAIQKSSKGAAWLLIGPPIFLVVITSRDFIPNARWSFGTSDRNQAKVAQGVAELGGGAANVSNVFKMYTEMIGATSATMVDTIIRQDRREERKEDVWFLIKGELNAMLSSVREEDPGLVRLIQHGLLGQCRAVVKAARAIDDPLQRFNTTSTSLGGVLQAASRFFSPTRRVAQAKYQELLNTKFVKLDDESIKYIRNIYSEGGGTIPSPLDLNLVTWSCQDIWRFILQGILKKSNVHRERLVEKAKEMDIEEKVIQTLWLEASGQDTGNKILNLAGSNGTLTAGAADTITRIIAKFYLRNEVRGRDSGSLLAEFVGKHDIRRVKTSLTGHMAYTEQARVASEEWSEKERLMFSASGLPYYQGIALYFLGMTFPFFAFLLLFPGKMGGFLLWFMLWMWIKSWDIALAVVMQLDDILWALLAVQKQELGKDERLPLDLQAAMTSIGEMDPTYQMTVYYTILAVCILAIPTVTAQLILGGMKGGASVISQGVARYSDFFSDAMLIGVQQGVTQRLNLDAKQLKQDYAKAYHEAGERGLIAPRPRSGGIDGVGSISNTTPGAAGMPGPGGGLGYSGRAGSINSATPSLGAGRGYASGISKFLGGGSKSNSAIGVAGRANNLPKLLEGYIMSKDVGRISQERTLEVAKASWDANVAADTYQIFERMALYGAIPVPWAALVNDFADKEMDLYKFNYQAEQGWGTQGIKVLSEGIAVAADGLNVGKEFYDFLNQGNISGALGSVNPGIRSQILSNLKDNGEAMKNAGIAATIYGLSRGEFGNEGGSAESEQKDFVPAIMKQAFENQNPFAEEVRQRERDVREGESRKAQGRVSREEYFDMSEIDIGTATQPLPAVGQERNRRIKPFGERRSHVRGVDDE